ncbi:MAG: transcription antitermination factor NusB [Erysipelotrichaceae bacterium]
MNRHKIRENLVFSVYQHLLLNKDLNSCVLDIFSLDNINEADEYLLLLLSDIKENKFHYIEIITPLLKKWSFNRLNYIDQAILLVGTSEILTAKVDRAVAIDEAVNIAKEYSDDESFKYINGVLDQIK